VKWFRQDEHVFPRTAAQAAKIVRAGGRVGVGSHGQLQGLGYHWEMWALAAGGLSGQEVLRAATLHGAEIIGIAQDVGSLEPGKKADLSGRRRRTRPACGGGTKAAPARAGRRSGRPQQLAGRRLLGVLDAGGGPQGAQRGAHQGPLHLQHVQRRELVVLLVGERLLDLEHARGQGQGLRGRTSTRDQLDVHRDGFGASTQAITHPPA
jgi:hypothetical protein